MALSNIFREPRREITESLVGIAALAAIIYADMLFAGWFRDICISGVKSPTGADHVGFYIIGLIVGGVSAFVTVGLVYFTHAIGEDICGALARRGLELRPKVRPR